MNQAELLRKLRNEKKLTLAEVAKASGVSTSALSRMENGERLGTIENITKLANFYDVSIDYLTCNPQRTEALDRLVDALVETGVIDPNQPVTKEVENIVIEALKVKIQKIKENRK